MKLTVLKNMYSIYRFASGATLPGWINLSGFYSITNTKEELSVVALQDTVNSGSTISSHGWRILKINGPLDLSLVGIIAEISAILRNKSIPVFLISTFDTDYILVKHEDTGRAIGALSESGHVIIQEE